MSVFLTIDPGEWIASNDAAFAIFDRFPVTPGHALVIPKRPVELWWDAIAEEKIALIELVDVVKRRLDAEYHPDGYNVGFNNGAAAGQTVDHLHLHVIPRHDGDVPDPRGGIRHVIPTKGHYPTDAPTLASAAPQLVTPSDGQMKLELLRALLREDLDQIDLLVSFVMRSGINLIARHLDDALARGARVRLLTTDYLAITDPAALGFFLDRLGPQGTGYLDARIFSDSATSFHPKAYLFTSSVDQTGIGFVGSSNLSRSGITKGVEWNIATRSLRELQKGFEILWEDPRCLSLTADWLDAYELRRRERQALRSPVIQVSPAPLEDPNDPASVDLDSRDGEGVTATPDASVDTLIDLHEDDQEGTPRPWSVQGEALTALEATRIEGNQAGLVVMATGLGKTWLAAFDSTRPEYRRVLFVAHREEILRQARDVYRQIRPGGRLTLYTSGERNATGDVVFASVQLLQRNLRRFPSEAFDYIVVDEFHHAAAPTYRKVISNFTPTFLLGLTATPDRADAADLLALCADNLVYDCNLVAGIERGLLSPFAYRAIVDVADYTHIPWRSGRFSSEELTNELATQARAEQVLREWTALGGSARRTLGFCCTITHAEFMAEQFRAAGVTAVAVHSGATSAPRTESLERLEAGSVSVVFTVDLFNEGVDLPTVDVVMLLRPTESPVVFFQQLGRGLRRADGKERLDVLDLVGNHRSFLLKARLLAKLAGARHFTDREAVTFLLETTQDEPIGLPEGCSLIVDTEVVDLLSEFVKTVSPDDQLVELIRQWVDEHDGERPTALAMALATGKSFSLKARGGWFGLLDQLGLLNNEEAAAWQSFGAFLQWIEYGAYANANKLVSLQVLARTGTLHSGLPLDELALTCRWDIFRDQDLRRDFDNIQTEFAIPSNPTALEWRRYWDTAVADLTNATRGSLPWFISDGQRLEPGFHIPDALRESLEAVTSEIVAYRLHRYLTQRKARMVGVQRRFVDGDLEIDATFTVEHHNGRASSVVMESSGGTRGSSAARNLDYVAGFDLLLARLRAAGIPVIDVYVDSTRSRDLPLADRRITISGYGYPIDLRAISDLEEFRKALLRGMREVGRALGAKGTGNSRKRTRLVLDPPHPWTAEALADALATGDFPRQPSPTLHTTGSA